MDQIDFISSFASMLDVTLEAKDAIDSRNMIAPLLGKSEIGLPYMLEEEGMTALRKGDWKFILGKKNKKGKGQPARLFDLSKDPEENVNIERENAELVEKLKTLHMSLVKSGGVRFYNKK